LVYTGGDIMEKRHYFTLIDDSQINSIKRTIVNNKVVGYEINEELYTLIEEEHYDTTIALPSIQPYEGIIAYSENNEI